MASEKTTDIFIAGLLHDANIKYETEKTEIKQLQEALNTASKRKTNEIGKPEFIAKVDEFIIIIEDKADIEKQALYCEKNNNRLDLRTDAVVNYAENGALHYAQHVVKHSPFHKVFAFGCSGKEKHHIIRPIYVNKRGYKLLEEVDNFENFNHENINNYYHEVVLDETPPDILEREVLIEKSKKLNEQLTFYGQVRDSEKPLVVSAILLALNENLDLDTLTGDDIKKDGDKIFNDVCCNLQRIKVKDNREAIMHQFNFIKDRPNLNTEHEKLGMTPLKYFAEFIKDEIFPSISVAQEDVLGFFYGEFIKYSGGDGQSLGIVLTPSHITELFCELLEITPQDRVFDPCVGTASFLVSAMIKMLNGVETEEEQDYIKQNNLHGIEIREDMFTIATTNMILRGDGKTNLVSADFLKQNPEDLQKQNYTVGMMNPPYSQRKNEETAHLSEMHFIYHLLESLGTQARCGVIVPQSTMIGKNTEDKKLKRLLLKNHTLEGVITLNADTTFYRVGTMPCIAIFTAHQPHPENKRCKFINFEDDGYKVRKHVGIVKTERALERREHLLKCWRDEIDAESKFIVKSTIKPTDEWLHSFYYFNDEIPTDNDLKNAIGDYLSFEFDAIMKNREYLFK